jgi:conserved oligomeric Golgi complex subunit 6
MHSPAAKQPSVQQPQRNPISLRLYKILGTKYSDDATIQALRTLSDLYYTPVQPQGKPKENEKDLDDLDEGEDLDCPEDTDPASPTKLVRSDQPFRENVPGETAMRARKNLQRDMELKLAEGSRQFLNALEQVVQVCVFQRA